MPKKKNFSRRDFIKTSTAVSVTAAFAGASNVFAEGLDKIKVGMIGCGGRGTGAMIDCLNADTAIELVAMGDLFGDKLEHSLNKLKGEFADRVKVTPEKKFTGFDNHLKVCTIDEIDLIVTAAPPGFRPMHFEAAINTGKHVFMEKPVATDPVGARKVIAVSEIAKQKGLTVVAGTQRRHQNHYIEIMKRIHDGQIGDIRAAQCYWNTDWGFLNWGPKDDPKWSEMERQCRRWFFYTWICGDHIVEQHVHNIDVVNWALDAVPVSCTGMGGRQTRTAPGYGNIYDHFAVEFEYANGASVMSMCRQAQGTSTNVSERILGTKGTAYTNSGSGKIKGENPYNAGGSPNPYVQEHTDLIKSIRNGDGLNEGKRVAESTMCAIMGRMSAYTGRSMKFDWALNTSKLDLMPKKLEFGPLETRPVAIPGKTPLI